MEVSDVIVTIFTIAILFIVAYLVIGYIAMHSSDDDLLKKEIKHIIIYDLRVLNGDQYECVGTCCEVFYNSDQFVRIDWLDNKKRSKILSNVSGKTTFDDRREKNFTYTMVNL